MTIYKKIFFFLFFFTVLFSIDNLRHIKNITSLLTTNDIKNIGNNKLLIASSGGLYEYNISNSNFTNYTNKLKFVDIRGIEVYNSNIWLLGNDSNIQVLDTNMNLLNVVTFAAFNKISKILFYNDYIFAIVSDENGEYLAQLSNEPTPFYLNKYNSFNINDAFVTINNLNDIYIKNNSIYLATDVGVIKADLINYNNNNLSILLDWNLENQFETLTIHEDNVDNIFYTYYENNELCNSDTNVCLDYTLSDYVDSFYYQGSTYFLFDKIFYKDDLGNYNIVFELPNHIESNFLNTIILDDIFYFGLENHGVISLNRNFNISDFILPNTLLSNNIESIDVSDNDVLVASVNMGSGGFIITNVFSNELIKNFYAESENYFDIDDDDNYETYLLRYPITTSSNSSNYYGKKLSYISGTKPNDIKLDNNGNIYITNSGIYLRANEFHPGIYNPFKDELEYLSGLLYLDSENIEIINGWDEEFSGIMSIYPPADGYNYTTLSQIVFDSKDNLFIVNPYSEINKPVAIKYNQSEYNWIQDNSQDLYLLPQEIAIDFNNNLWIAYQKDDDPSFSPGGIRVVQLRNVENSNDDIWRNNPLDIVEEDDCYSKLENPNINISLEDNYGDPISVWSLDIGSDIYGHTLLWVISDYGVMSYVITNYQYSQGQGYLQDIAMTPIRCNFYFPDLSFNENSKIRIDNQNNAWIINDEGIRIIKSNGEIFSDEFILDELSENLLSNIINDIAFDERGYVYIGTDKGISIFESTYSKNIEINKISVSPNPFVIGQSNGLTISNIPSESTIHIMNLSGRIVKEFQLQNESVIINWDGKGDNNQFLSTGIYLVAGIDSGNSFGVTKLAVIRK